LPATECKEAEQSKNFQTAPLNRAKPQLRIIKPALIRLSEVSELFARPVQPRIVESLKSVYQFHIRVDLFSFSLCVKVLVYRRANIFFLEIVICSEFARLTHLRRAALI